MTRDEAHAIIMAFPETEEGVSYSQPSYKAFGKFLSRLRKEDDSLVLMVSFDEREMLMEADPATFHLTPHYQKYPCVLARISGLEPDQLRSFLDRRWRKVAPKKWLKQWEAAQ